jgi:hypothetical protein
MSECRFKVGSLGRGGIPEAAYLGDEFYIIERGVLGEIALPSFRVLEIRSHFPGKSDAGR